MVEACNRSATPRPICATGESRDHHTLFAFDIKDDALDFNELFRTALLVLLMLDDNLSIVRYLASAFNRAPEEGQSKRPSMPLHSGFVTQSSLE